MDKKEWLIEVKIKSYNGARQWKEWTINEAKRFTNDEKWNEYTSRWRKLTWKNVRMTDRRTNRRIKRGRTYLQVSTIIYDWSNDNVKISCSLQRTRSCACVPSSGEIEKLKMAALVVDKRRKICKINTLSKTLFIASSHYGSEQLVFRHGIKRFPVSSGKSEWANKKINKHSGLPE